MCSTVKRLLQKKNKLNKKKSLITVTQTQESCIRNLYKKNSRYVLEENVYIRIF